MVLFGEEECRMHLQERCGMSSKTSYRFSPDGRLVAWTRECLVFWSFVSGVVSSRMKITSAYMVLMCIRTLWNSLVVAASSP